MARTFPSHDWHVQPSCQRPNRFPPERRVFSPEGSPVQLSSLRSTGRVRDPAPHKKLLRPRNLIKLLDKATGPAAGMSTDCAHRISTGNPHWELDRKADSSRLKPARNDNGSGRLAARLKPRPFKSHCPGTLVDYATERIFRHAVPQAQTSGSARAHSARAFSAKAGRKTLG